VHPAVARHRTQRDERVASDAIGWLHSHCRRFDSTGF